MGESVRVEAASGAYDVHIGAGLLASLPDTIERQAPRSTRVHVVVDTGVPNDLVERAISGIERTDRKVSRTEIVPSESIKTIETWRGVLADMARATLDRSDVVVAIGGGIVGDIAGFAGATYRRGLTVIQCPTTLLAMVDASVGGKTGVNLDSDVGLLKNAVGAFHQPKAVIADTTTLLSLSERIYRSGLGECVKHSMLSGDFGDADLADWMEAQQEAILGRDIGVLSELVTRNVRVKAEVVESDEREDETGEMGRALLNLGHTFAHALETHAGLRVDMSDETTPLLHGEAVSLGLVCASALSERLGKTTDFTSRVRARLEALGLPTRVQGIEDTDVILERMQHDKKSMAGSIRFIVPISKARSRVVGSPEAQMISEALSAIQPAS